MPSFLQSTEWEHFLQAYGTPVQRVRGALCVDSSNRLAKSWSCYRSSSLDFIALPETLSRAVFIRFEPENTTALLQLQTFATHAHHALEPTLSVQPHQTLVKSLSSDEELLASMRPKHRYNVRLAERKGVQVHTYTEYNPDVFERFWELLSTTSERQEFATFPKHYYRTQWQNLKTFVLIAEHEGQDLACMLLLIHDDTAIYLHGGSGASKEYMAPYALQFQAMRFARSQGCSFYDFWGTDLAQTTLGEWEAQEGTRSYGTSRFKIGFGGQVISYPGTWDLILNPFWYALYNSAHRWRGRKRAFR